MLVVVSYVNFNKFKSWDNIKLARLSCTHTHRAHTQTSIYTSSTLVTLESTSSKIFTSRLRTDHMVVVCISNYSKTGSKTLIGEGIHHLVYKIQVLKTGKHIWTTLVRQITDSLYHCCGFFSGN